MMSLLSYSLLIFIYYISIYTQLYTVLCRYSRICDEDSAVLCYIYDYFCAVSTSQCIDTDTDLVMHTVTHTHYYSPYSCYCIIFIYHSSLSVISYPVLRCVYYLCESVCALRAEYINILCIDYRSWINDEYELSTTLCWWIQLTYFSVLELELALE